VRAFIRPLSRWADELEVKREAACAQEQKAAPGMKRFVPPAEVTRADVARVVSNAEELYANQAHLLSALEAAHKAGGSQAVVVELLDKVTQQHISLSHKYTSKFSNKMPSMVLNINRYRKSRASHNEDLCQAAVTCVLTTICNSVAKALVQVQRSGCKTDK
jgi:hypothetical protein